MYIANGATLWLDDLSADGLTPSLVCDIEIALRRKGIVLKVNKENGALFTLISTNLLETSSMGKESIQDIRTSRNSPEQHVSSPAQSVLPV